MSKKTKRLEKENLALSRKSETTNRNLLEMAEERTRHQKELDMLKKKNIKLENLCRALQAERTKLEHELRREDGDELLEGSEDDSGEYEDSGDGYDDGSEEGSEEDQAEDTEEELLPEESLQQEAVGMGLEKNGKVKSMVATMKNGIHT